MTVSHADEATAPVPLTRAQPGQRVRIMDIDAGQELRSRLCAMGLTIGMAVNVVAVGDGPVILSVMGSRLVLGHGMAAKVMIRRTHGCKS